MSNYDIIYLGKKAQELGFVRDTLEKVTRLADILEYFNYTYQYKCDHDTLNMYNNVLSWRLTI